jgi:hypothetical protein
MHWLSYVVILSDGQWHSCYGKRREIRTCRIRLYLYVQKTSDVLHIEILQRRHRFLWICKNLYRFYSSLCAQSYFRSFLSCLDRKELMWHVKKACDVLITSGMTLRSFNDSVLSEHIESIRFSELNNEAEGKVTSMDKRKWSEMSFYYVCYSMSLSHTKLNGVICYATRH